VPGRRLADPPSGTLPASGRRPRRRGLLFAALCTACVVVAGGYLALAAQRARDVKAAAPVAVQAAAPASLDGRPRLLFRSTALDSTYGKLGLVPLSRPDGPRVMTQLDCDRVYMAAGRGLCLAADRGVITTYAAVLFGPDFAPRHRLPIPGLPSRARLSPDGRLAAMTVFVTGHSYAGGAFSTRTSIVDTDSGRPLLDDLERLTVLRDGRRWRRADFNFWGVTFVPGGDRFYATLASGGRTWLLEGDLRSRSARVLRGNVECPSISPDGTRLAYKRRMPGIRVTWRLHVLDLATMADTPLAETRSVDDQVEWLDDRQVLYSLADGDRPTAVTDTWVVPAGGGGSPRILTHAAFSPAVQRG
jgi:WD40-like Beta Propeller Repeat